MGNSGMGEYKVVRSRAIIYKKGDYETEKKVNPIMHK